MATFTVAFLAMGVDRAYEPGTYATSMIWCIVSLILGAICAVAGGWICGLISKSNKAVLALAILVLVLGVVTALATPGGGTPAARPADVSPMDGMMKSVQPLWVAWLNAVIGPLGAYIGGKLYQSKKVDAVA